MLLIYFHSLIGQRFTGCAKQYDLIQLSSFISKVQQSSITEFLSALIKKVQQAM